MRLIMKEVPPNSTTAEYLIFNAIAYGEKVSHRVKIFMHGARGGGKKFSVSLFSHKQQKHLMHNKQLFSQNNFSTCHGLKLCVWCAGKFLLVPLFKESDRLLTKNFHNRFWKSYKEGERDVKKIFPFIFSPPCNNNIIIMNWHACMWRKIFLTLSPLNKRISSKAFFMSNFIITFYFFLLVMPRMKFHH